MENIEPKNTDENAKSVDVSSTDESLHTEDPNKSHKPIEHHYAEHEQDPGPSPQAVKEYNDRGAGPVMKWIIPILVLALLIYWFVIRK